MDKDLKVYAWKVLRVRQDGSLGSLFVDGSRVLVPGEWLTASQSHSPSWLKVLPGWHAHKDKTAADKLLKANPNRRLFKVALMKVSHTDPNGRIVAQRMKIMKIIS